MALFSLAALASVCQGAPEGLGGRTASDLIPIDPGALNIPLRKGGVIPGSELLFLDGQALKKDVDYAMDYAEGVVYLMKSTRPGQSLRATYRYGEAKEGATSSAGIAPLNGLAFQGLGGQQKLMMGFGMARRLQDGTVMSSNMYGMANKFGFRGGSLSGVMAYSNQKRAKGMSLMDGGETASNAEEGEGQAILQRLDLDTLGGKFWARHQDISKKFAGFQSFRESGMDESAVQALEKEKGLKRSGFGFSNMGGKALRLGMSLDTVRDGKNEITWRTASVKSGGLSLNYQSKVVDKGFKRFQDLSEKDRGQLAKEQGLTSDVLGLGFESKRGSASFEQTKVESSKNESFHRRKLNLQTGGFKAKFSDQQVGAGYQQFEGTRQSDWQQLSREQGTRRQSLELGYSGPLSLTFSESWLRDQTPKSPGLFSQDFQLGYRGLKFESRVRDASFGFSKMNALGDGEVQSHVEAIGRMQQPGDFWKKPEENGQFRGNPGLGRSGQRLTAALGKGRELMLQTNGLQGGTDQGRADQFAFRAGDWNLNYRNAVTGTGLHEFGQAMEFERQFWGGMMGLRRSDFALNGRGFGYSRTDAFRNGPLQRQTMQLNLPTIGIAYSQRKISPEFQGIDQFHDPERDLLNQLAGYDQSDLSLRFSAIPKLGFEGRSFQSRHMGTGERRLHETQNWKYDLNRLTQIEFSTEKRSVTMPDENRLGWNAQRLQLKRDFGNFGKLCWENELVKATGPEAPLPSFQRNAFCWDYDIDPKTKLQIARNDIQFEDGTKETTESQSLSRTLTPRTGISLSETKTKREADKPSEKRSQYGFWWDFGGGMRFSYNMARQSNTMAPGTQQSSIGLTPGQIAGLTLGAASYSENVTDRTRFENTGAFQISTSKPLQWGKLNDLTFRFGTDTYRDQNRFMRENRSMGAGFRLGSTVLGWDYLSQVAPNGDLGVDRTFKLATSQDPKAKFRLQMSYKLRTLPGGQEVMIRNYSGTWRVAGMEIGHDLSTNPELPRGDLLLGSQAQGTSSSKWRLKPIQDGNFQYGLSWEEQRRESEKVLTRTVGLNLTLNAKNPSPVSLFYGLEQNDRGNQRKSIHRYHLQYDQRPGPNQWFSLFVGNVGYQNGRDAGRQLQNWALRVEYQLRF